MKKLIQFFVAQSIFWSGTVYCSYTPVAATPGTTVWQIEDTTQGIIGGNNIITQAMVPFTITQPGTYAVAEDLTGAIIIIVNSDNVTVDLKGHTLTASTATGVLAVLGNNVTISNGRVVALSNNTTVVSVNGSRDRLTLRDLQFRGTPGVVNGSKALAFQAATIHNNFIIENCFFSGLATALDFTNAASMNNVVVAQCTFVECRFAIELSTVNNTILQDLVIQEGKVGISTGVTALSTTNFLSIDNVVLENVGQLAGDAAIILNNSTMCFLSSVDVIVTGNQGGSPVPNLDGIVITGATDGCIIDRCTISGTTGDGLNVSGSPTNIIVRECTVENCTGVGINFQPTLSPTNHVYNTISSNNGGGNFIGTDGSLIATDVADTTTANYWYNVGY